ncbi:zinc ribbon domain-containing protein [Ktedonobacter racemifer]|uniref:Transposase IS605 OrfB n=1 Tax=Ktedonobacter racemifer DSM 44963 TaxID=485913 RepID=D6TJ83_KTERA|nr:zinc ribbon domain-containing protein [Ktedonobacter racemifer]EFH89490.1 transposase IS605 OrfB [Ktedonobacter racemifer DSM 44963]
MKRTKTPTFLLELPLQVDWSQERCLRAHLEAARCLYNAVLSEANKRLRRMRNDPAWAKARALPRSHSQARAQAFSALRNTYHFSEYEMHDYVKSARISWIADHIESTMAQTLATRAYQATNRVCVGKAKRVRFRSKERGIDSVEGKRNDVGMRFVLDPNAGDGGFLIWNEQVIPALIDWRDPVIQHGLRHTIKYVRLVRRRASSPQAHGADHDGYRYCVQLILEGHAFIKPKHTQQGSDSIGLDIGPSTLAIVPRTGKADLVTFCEELAPDTRKKRRLQRKMDRQRRANNPENYDEKGRVKKQGKTRLRWRESKRYQATRRQHANTERRLAAHRKSLHGNLAHTIAQMGNTITLEKTSFKGWQKQYGRSVGLRAPGMFVAHLARIVAKTGGTLVEVSAYKTKLSQYCHHCGRYVKKSRSQRWHSCDCGLGPVQRDLYSAFLLAHLDPEQTIPSVTQPVWEGAEPRLRAVMEGLRQRANEGHVLPRSMGLLASDKAARARARRLKSPAYPHQEPLSFSGENGSVG